MKIVTPFAFAAALALAACTAAPTVEQTQTVKAKDSTNAPACTEATQADAVAHALAQPIQPPRFAAGLDLAADDQWSGIKQAGFETALCAGTAQGEDGTSDKDMTSYFSWGADGQLMGGFLQATNQLTFVQFNAGYTGGVEFKSRDGQHTYSAKIGAPILKDGAALNIDWTGNVGPVGSEIVDALVATFAPSLPAIEGDCRASQRCLLRVLPGDDETGKGATGIVGSRDVHFYVVFPADGGDVADMSKSQYFYMFPSAVGFTPPPPPPTP